MIRFALFLLGFCTIIVVSAGSVGLSERIHGPNLLKSSDQVTLYREDSQGNFEFVAGNLAQATGIDAQATLLEFLKANPGVYRVVDPDKAFKQRCVEVDEQGITHVRLQQYHNDVRVMYGELVGHISFDSVLSVVNGKVWTDLTVNTEATVAAEEAEQIARNDLGGQFDVVVSQRELVVFVLDEDDYLCWRLMVRGVSQLGRWEYLIDAHDGSIVTVLDRLISEAVVGSGIGVMGEWRYHVDTDYDGAMYFLVDNTRQLNTNPHGHDGQMPDGGFIQTNLASTTLPGSVAMDGNNEWVSGAQTAALDAHVYAGLFYDYLLHRLGRNSFDDLGTAMLNVVNYSGQGDNNAYWDGSRIIVWSASDGWRSMAGCPDVIAHEWAHAVTEYCSELVYAKEPGALNESFSDMMGAAFEFAHDTLDTPDWLAGENARFSGDAFRSMSDPHEYNDPDYYGPGDTYWTDVNTCVPNFANDFCGVHSNSGVGNKWFYLLSDGGTHHDVEVSGIGVHNAMKIAYRANRYYWTSLTDYHSGALGTIAAAQDLDSTDLWTQQVALAWNAVGVSTPGPSVIFSFPEGVTQFLLPMLEDTIPVTVRGTLGGTPLTGSGLLHYSIDQSPWQQRSLVPVDSNRYRGVLPMVSCGSMLRFYFSYQEQSGARFYDVDTAAPHLALPMTEIVTVFTDDFETDKNWTVSGDAQDGHWERGVPDGGGDRGDPPADFDGSGQCFLTDNLDGNSDVDNGSTTLVSPVIDMAGNDGVLHLARWFSNSWGTDPYTDVMEIYLSNDQGQSWVLAQTVGPVEQSDGGWRESDIRVSDILMPGDSLRVRVTVSDMGEASIVEAGVDDMVVTTYACIVPFPIILTDSLPGWTAGAIYQQQLLAHGGLGTLIWSDLNSDLIGSGLYLDSTGRLTGIAVDSGMISFTARVTDTIGSYEQQAYQFYVNPALTITTANVPDWTIDRPLERQLEVAGGTSPLEWTVSDGNLSDYDLTFSEAGVIDGTPTDTGTVSLEATITDHIGASVSRIFSFSINPQLSIGTRYLPDGPLGAAYSESLQVSGGSGPAGWLVLESNLADFGLAIDSATGVTSGQPGQAGSVTATIVASDSTGSADTASYQFFIYDGLHITTPFLVAWTAGYPYSYQMSADGGVGLLTWSSVGQGLTSSGLTLDSTGLIDGIPSATGTITFVAQVTDDSSVTQRELTMTVNDSLTIQPDTLLRAREEALYVAVLRRSGGTSPMVWSNPDSALDSTGLVLNQNGVLWGMPVHRGSYSFVARVHDTAGCTSEHLFALPVGPPYVCGDVNDSGGDGPDIVDLTFLVEYMFHNGPQPIDLSTADVNGSTDIPDIVDVIYLVSYMFHGGAPLNCLDASNSPLVPFAIPVDR